MAGSNTYRRFRKLKGRLNAGVITPKELQELDMLNRTLAWSRTDWKYTVLSAS